MNEQVKVTINFQVLVELVPEDDSQRALQVGIDQDGDIEMPSASYMSGLEFARVASAVDGLTDVQQQVGAKLMELGEITITIQ